jgi:hypothetical protein
MSKLMFLVMIVGALLLGTLLAACGRASGSSDAVVARVDGTPITESTLNHWVATFVRGDFYQVNGHKTPVGLATNPPNYASCVTAAKTLAPAPSSGKRILTAAELGRRCHLLYRFVREEALTYLISALWDVGMTEEIGKHVSDQEVEQYLHGLVKRQYKTRQAFVTYLAARGWSLADMHYILKRNLLDQLLTADAEKKANRLGGSEHAMGEILVQREAKWVKKTSCRPGDVVMRCAGWKAKAGPTKPDELSPAVIFEEMNGGRYVSAAHG